VATADITDPSVVLDAASVLGWPVLAGPRSGLRGPGGHGIVVSAFDAILRHQPTAARLRPDVVLRLGGLPASKVTNAWLDELDADQVVADPHRLWIDPGRTASEVIVASPEAVCRSIVASGAAPAPDGWAASWRAAETTAQQTIESVLARHGELTEPGVARAVTRALPAAATLLVASSMPIRDVEWYGDPTMTCRVVANRGANGIDGFVSTALGVAAAGSGPTVGLVGDLAFLHDGGGLLGAASRGIDCTFVVIDNDGGGIFSFLPQATALPESVFESYFGTPQGVDIGLLAGVHGIPSVAVTESASVGAAVRDGIAAGGVQLVLVRTDRHANVAVHDELVAAVGSALDRA
jgi:2-succinyl-5-enolpyruvyl-6-hydroxy-3-cyclohexene-1-carboxylate synthase